MRLVDYLTIRLSGIFILIMLIWSGVYFVIQMAEIYDGIDEGLNNLKQEFIYKANRSADFTIDMQKHNPLNIRIEKIAYEEALHFREEYATTKVYFVTEQEEEEVRMLTTAFFCEPDGQYYKLKFFSSTVESDDLIKNMLYLLIVLWLCLAIAMIVANKIVIHKTNKPFYQLLDNLRNFRLGKTRMISFQHSSISEYTELNESVEILLTENIRTFTEQKNFIENASHEMQTPLAIAMGKLELLMNSEQLTQLQMEEINATLACMTRMKRLNSSLLLLSKIKNKQFVDNENIDLTEVFKEVLANFDDLIEHKHLKLSVEGEHNSLMAEMNKDLAYIMANNLIKNAIYHNIKGGAINIVFTSDAIVLSNDGNPIPEGKDIFDRYVSSTPDANSSGLGLPIVKTIAEVYKFDIGHAYKGKHIFTLTFARR